MSAINQDGLCNSCSSIALPAPGKFWSREFLRPDLAATNYRSGCRFCALVLKQLKIHTLDPKGWDFENATIRLETRTGVAGLLHCKMTYANGNTTEDALIIRYPNDAPTEPLTLQEDIDEALTRVRKCVDTHQCASYSGMGMPTRLIDVTRLAVAGQTQSDYIRLIATDKSVRGPYTALSYCWGTSTAFKTTAANLQSRLEGFAVADMPATLRESVKITRGLGIQYLWIDALCIIQPKENPNVATNPDGADDPVARADWLHESAHMDQVYGGAYLTLVAAGASDCNGGLVRGRPTCSIAYTSDGKKQKAVATLRVPTATEQTGKVAFHHEPISNRAWAYQEWLLSNRLLVYTTTGMHFVCDKCELPAFHRSQKYRLPRLPGDISGDDWRHIIAGFSARNLSCPSDKLPAISGVAKRYAEIAKLDHSDYLAGLWRDSLIQSLNWRSIYGEGFAMFLPLSYNRGRCLIDGKARAPSWSWASIDGPVIMDPGEKILATVTSCTTKPKSGHDQFGEIESGTMTVCCRSVTTSLMSNPPTERLRLCGNGDYVGPYFWPDDASEVPRLSFDEKIGKAPELFCLLLMQPREEGHASNDGNESGDSEGSKDSEIADRGMGLVIRRDSKTDRLRRVGWFSEFSGASEAPREFEIW